MKGVIGDKYPLNLYYAYGIRNTFGMDFDPLTGNLWDTENGPDYGDEINLVKPGFNSGWSKVQGFWKNRGATGGELALNPTSLLVNIDGAGRYSSPEFTWFNNTGPTIGVTAIKFLNSDKLGKQYQNDIFVADYHAGNIYHFDLNQSRTGLALNGPLSDKMANSLEELKILKFAEGFGSITDLEVGPDGYLYIVSNNNPGNIYRIVSRN